MTLNIEDHKLEQFDQGELEQYLINVFRLAMLHYGLWFNEVQHQLGLEETLGIEAEVSERLVPIIMKKLAQPLGYQVNDKGIPLSLASMPKQKLFSLVDAMSANWLATDGVWFQTVEKHRDMFTAKRCNDTCWTRFSPLEASVIKSLPGFTKKEGLAALKEALDFRIYARINKFTTEWYDNELIYRAVTCRVQYARKTKGLEDYPCKSAGSAEYESFARTIDPHIKTECIACPPDTHPAEWACAWRFYIPNIY